MAIARMQMRLGIRIRVTMSRVPMMMIVLRMSWIPGSAGRRIVLPIG